MSASMQCAKCFRVCRLSDSGKTWVCTICKHREKANGGQAVSDTPRTDAHSWHDGDYDDPLHAFADFAKQLERELNAANEKAQRYYEAILKHKAENEHLTDKIHQLYEGAEEQKQRIKRLLDTGDYLCAAAAFMGWHDKIEDWNKAKENK